MAAVQPPISLGHFHISSDDLDQDPFNLSSAKPPWEKLPPELLVKIFSHLDDIDKESVEATCCLWHEACDHPSLWKTQHFYFNGENSLRLVQQGCRTIERKGYFLRHLTVKIGYPSLPQAWIMSQCVQQLLEFISRYPFRSIETFQVNKLNFFTQWRFFTLSRRNILVALNNFLLSQKDLRVVDFTSCRLSADDGMRILRTLRISTSCQSIRKLELHEFFQRKYCATSGSRFTFMVTSSFSSLKELGVDAKHIDDHFLEVLTKKSPARLTLRKLKVYFEMFKCPKAFITEQCWSGARESCPDLNVSFCFCGWLIFQGVKKILVPSVPLTECFIMWPRVYRQQYDRHRDLSETIDRVTQLYSTILERFVLRSDIKPYPDLDMSLIRSAKTCKRVQEFKVTLRLMSDVVKEITDSLSQRSPPVDFRLVERKYDNITLPRLRPRNKGS